MDDGQRGTRLATLTALACVLALGVAMAAWAAAQLAMDSNAEPARVFAEHAGHVVLLGITIYVVLYLLFRRWLVQPLRRVSSHLYGIATGRLEPLELESPVAEIARLASGVDLMVRRMKQGLEPHAVDEAQARLQAVNAVAAQLRESAPELADELMLHTRHLRAALLTITEGAGGASPHRSNPEGVEGP